LLTNANPDPHAGLPLVIFPPHQDSNVDDSQQTQSRNSIQQEHERFAEEHEKSMLLSSVHL